MSVAVDQIQHTHDALLQYKSERTIEWNKDPFGRTGQFQRLFWIIEEWTRQIIAEHHANVETLRAIKDLGDNMNSADIRASYGALESVVHDLLRIEHGKTRLSREDAQIIGALQATASKFQAACSTSKEAAAEMARGAESCMRLGDIVHQSIELLDEHMRSLNIESKAVWGVKSSESGSWEHFRNRQGELERHLRDAREDRNSIGTGFLGFFDNSATERADRRVQDADRELYENNGRIFSKQRSTTIFYQLTMMSRNTSAAIGALKAQLEQVAQEYDADFRRVVDELKVANTMWDGLLDLRNMIQATDLYTTRDSSLRVILELLQRDDEVFQRQAFFEDTQARIQDAVCAKLGGDAIARIMSPEAEVFDDAGLSEL